VTVCESKFKEDGKEKKQRQKFRKWAISNSFPDVKSSIPGLDSNAKVSSPIDVNLAPLDSIPSKTFQYGQTNFISINTDHPQWSPGVCLDLDKYQGIFKVKSTNIHQKVN
jgi:hypothetical protein